MRCIISIVVAFITGVSSDIIAEEYQFIQGGVAYYHKISSKELVDMKRIYALDPVTGHRTIIFESEKIIDRITLSPNGKLIGALADDKLIIINLKGQKLQTLAENVKRYSWQPIGDKISFLSFAPKDADYPFRFPAGVWVSDIATGEKKKIAEGAQKIVWARFDSCVYFSDWKKVYKWNPKTDKVDTTDYKDFYFSPDGMYYYYLPHLEVGGPIQLFERSTNKDISHILPEDLGSLSGWVFNQRHFLLFVKADVITETVGEGPVKVVKSREVRNVQNFIFDVEKRKVVKEFDGKISPWVGNGSKIIVEREGKMVFEEVPEGY